MISHQKTNSGCPTLSRSSQERVTCVVFIIFFYLIIYLSVIYSSISLQVRVTCFCLIHDISDTYSRQQNYPGKFQRTFLSCEMVLDHLGEGGVGGVVNLFFYFQLRQQLYTSPPSVSEWVIVSNQRSFEACELVYEEQKSLRHTHLLSY